ncbi:hypothetical protein HPB47_007818 [Ixodes persulcatus]|uniref:Uncharacterized protein n=1 Tax=Ixodes persulcatus TaxID=34615 RepID=A0AC60P797_IXOPE|nr:hypothetical protein HPB47_007818 [Ixodes persulcatus]
MTCARLQAQVSKLYPAAPKWTFSGVSTAHAQQQQTGVRHFWWRFASASRQSAAIAAIATAEGREAVAHFHQRQQTESRIKFLPVSLCKSSPDEAPVVDSGDPTKQCGRLAVAAIRLLPPVEQQETDTMAEVVDNSEDQCTPSADTANDMCVAEDCDAATPLRDIHQRRLVESRIVELERQLQAEKLRTQAQSQMIMKLEEKMSEIKVTTLSLANIMDT